MRTQLDNANKFLRLLRKKRSAFPEEIQIEITNACNLKCEMCPHTQGLVPKQDFSFKAFQSLLANNPAPKRLVLTGWGEPLMHPYMFDMIRESNQQWPKTSIRFTTNGVLLNEATRDLLKQVKVSRISISVDCYPGTSTWKSNWQDILHPPSPKVIRNIEEYFADQELHRKTPLLLQCVLVPENVEDIQLYIKLLSNQKHSQLNLVRLQNYPGMSFNRMDWTSEQSLITQLINYGKEHGVSVNSLNQQSLPIQIATHHDQVCMRTDDSIYINYDGTCTPCCNLREYSIGLLQENDYDIKSIWNSERENDFFKQQNSICGSCDALFHNYKS